LQSRALCRAEQLEFETGHFDLVVSYLTLVDIADFRKAIGEMARVLKAGGSLLIANRFASACAAQGWWRTKRANGCIFRSTLSRRISVLVRVGGIHIENWHRPAHCLHDNPAGKPRHGIQVNG
jgi:SAM-dependent methyltransferase